jgi:hypothetical protein
MSEQDEQMETSLQPADPGEIEDERSISDEPLVAEREPTKAPTAHEAMQLLERLQEIRGSRVLTFVTRPDVAVRGDVVEHIYEQLREIGRIPRLDLFLHSPGGQTEVPWRVITLIRDFAEHFAVLIPGIAYSAATHLAMGADEIVMGPLSELSPVDPARSHPLLPQRSDGQPLAFSVQDLRHCVEFVTKQVGDSSPDALATIVAVLFEKVHPLAIGAMQQSYELARLISKKALATHMDIEADGDKIQAIVDAFSDEFFSHDYRIGWREAKEKGLKVTYADSALWDTMWDLYKHYQAFFNLARPIDHGKLAARPVVWIDSMHRRRILEELYQQIADEVTGSVQLKRSMSRWLVTPWQTSTDDGEE